MNEKISPFACDMTAIPPDQRHAHLATIEKLFRAVEDLRELPDGYAFKLSNDSQVLLTAAQFVALERLCCPFFGFTLEIEREGGGVWLSLTGREGVKPFIIAEIGEPYPPQCPDCFTEQVNISFQLDRLLGPSL
jgi:hypothetical protein